MNWQEVVKWRKFYEKKRNKTGASYVYQKWLKSLLELNFAQIINYLYC